MAHYKLSLIPFCAFSPLRAIIFIFTLCTLIILASCASQKSPTGGPGDQEGPQIIATLPATGSVNYKEQSIYFAFNEFIDRASARKALTVEPDLGIPFEIKHRRKSFKLQFEEPLPDSTTVIIKMGADLQDTFRNKMESPKTIAFSTGPRIDRASLGGRLLQAETGKGVAEQRVLLYAEDQSLEDPARYIAETDTGGYFRFEYLREGFYSVLWVEDANRNRIADFNREPTSTFYQEKIELKRDTLAILQPIYITTEDTLKPSIFEVGLLTTNRLKLMFSEEVDFDEQSSLYLVDTTQKRVEAYFLYREAEYKENLLAQTMEPLAEEMQYTLFVDSVFDIAGNRTNIEFGPLDGSAQKDSVLQDIVPYGILDNYFEDDTLVFRYKKGIQDLALADSFFVSAQNDVFKPWEKVRVEQNRLLIVPDSLWDIDKLTFNLWDPQDLSYVQYSPEIWRSQEFGSLELLWESWPDTLSALELRLFDEEERVYANQRIVAPHRIDSLGSSLIENLPPKKLKLVVFADKNANRNYDLGSISPFTTPEYFFMQPAVDIRTGFTTELMIDFNAPMQKLIDHFSASEASADSLNASNEAKPNSKIEGGN